MCKVIWYHFETEVTPQYVNMLCYGYEKRVNFFKKVHYLSRGREIDVEITRKKTGGFANEISY